MTTATLLATAVLTLATAAGFAAVGASFARRPAPAAGRSAVVMFALFWASAGIVWLAQGLGTLSGALGIATLPLIQAFDQVSTPFYCLAAAGLLYYVLYLLTGRRGLLLPVLGYYLVLAFALRYLDSRAAPVDVVVRTTHVAFVYAQPLVGPAYTVVIALVAVPILGAVVAYGSLFFRVDEPPLRYRVALVSLGLLVWVATEAASFASGLADSVAGEMTRRVVALAAMLLIYAAYHPPRAARERWGAQVAP